MSIAMIVLGALAFAGGVQIFTSAQSAVHEIEALLCFLMGFVGFGSGAVGMAVDRLRRSTAPEPTKAAKPAQ